MAISDFTIYQHAETENTLETASPIADTFSFVFQRASGAGLTGSNAVFTALKGFPKGKLRMLFRWDTGPSGSSRGLTINCMQSVVDIVGGSGNFYRLNIKAGAWEIKKITGGTVQTSGTLIASDTFTTVNGTVYAVEFEWKAGTSSIDFIARRGTALDYSDLADVITHTDSTAPFLTSLAEGFGYSDVGAGSSFKVVYDDIEFRKFV